MEHDPYQVLAQRLRRRRTDAGLSLEKLGERAGVSGAYISHIEAGRKKPTLYTIERLATALQTKAEDLLVQYGKSENDDARHVRRFQELTRGLD